ncbi:hypothetical protein ACFFS2_25455 [Streptomyces aurantiacus]|uniref:Uncharacterized protein n=1 Tax=Streptomyces aurantiacus TaxID=47760 RepID=A0A7G1PGI5_9ACTN|nr:hypothetical protein [Streptomyces aurantiacus]BCL32996.1 hypothetical protein GCM10017557_78550 [Streptomyces aurantiacus]
MPGEADGDGPASGSGTTRLGGTDTPPGDGACHSPGVARPTRGGWPQAPTHVSPTLLTGSAAVAARVAEGPVAERSVAEGPWPSSADAGLWCTEAVIGVSALMEAAPVEAMAGTP